MPETINVHEAKTHLSKLLERVKAGEEIVLAKGRGVSPTLDLYLWSVSPASSGS